MPLSRPETTPHPPVHGKTVFRETGPQKGWVPLSCSSLCSDTWRWSQIPQVRTQPHETAHHTHNLGHQSQVQLLTASYQLATSRRFPQPYPWVQLICEWGLQNSEEQFTYSITSLHKGYNSGKARGQRCTGQRVDEGAPSEHGSSGHHPPNASVCSAAWKLFQFHSPGMFMEASLHGHTRVRAKSLQSCLTPGNPINC